MKKTGKFLYSFDVYDGTSTITCKLFATPEQNVKISKRLKPGVGVKVKGRAGFDNFAKEITVISNVVIEEGAIIQDSVLMPNCHIGKNARIYKALVASDVTIEEDREVNKEQEKVVLINS